VTRQGEARSFGLCTPQQMHGGRLERVRSITEAQEVHQTKEIGIVMKASARHCRIDKSSVK
jgi:hypothetical protein